MAADQQDTKTLNEQLIDRLNAEYIVSVVSRKFAEKETGISRVNFVYDLMKTKRILPPLIKDAKNNSESEYHRGEGNKMFGKAKYREAHEFYTRSIALAVPGSSYAGLAYANRSAVLFEKKLYGECLKDAILALENNFPEYLNYKLIKRIEVAKHLLDESNKIIYYKRMPKISVKDRNALIPSAATSVKVEYSQALGRCVVATRDIEPGEIIAMEKAFCSVLEKKNHLYCHHCLELCYTLIPCPKCTQALFCNGVCRDLAHDEYHKYECPILESAKKVDINKMLHLKLTIVVRNFYSNVDRGRIKPSELLSPYRSDRYDEIYNLVSNTWRRSKSDLFSRAVSAAGFFHLLQEHTTFFQDKAKGYEDVFKELLFLHMQIGSCNFHEISSRLSTDATGTDYALGSAAFSFLSLFNHSCSPNISRYEYGSVGIVFTIKSIRKGEQCFDNYGQHYALMSKADRRKKLKKQYCFDCNCEACLNDYGTYNSLPAIGENRQSVLETFQLLQSGRLTEAENALPEMIKGIKQMETKMPNKDLGEFQEALKQCYFIFSTMETPI